VLHEFARSCGGSVSIDSAEGVGTAVSLLLPRDTTEPARADNGVLAPEPPLGDGETILLVEDNERVLGTTHALLEGLGYAVVPARNGREALDILRSGELVHAVLSDVLMPPGMSGYDVARHVLEERPDLHVILTSGFNSVVPPPGDRLEHVARLAKPYTRGLLAAALESALGPSRATPTASPSQRTHSRPARRS
jgi:CheY-like chemotaxis protein